MWTWTIDLPDAEATRHWGQRLADALFPNAVVALIGPLGAGKTLLVRAVAEGLGLPDPRIVSSPTFGLIHEYPAKLPVYHFDVYRLRSPDEFADLGPEEYFSGGGVCLIEWADKVASCLPADHLRLRFEVTGPTSRRLHFEALGPRHAACLAAMRGA
ncbi:MAG: tRNA (adenosine(37)-N6)-threonylcarbamoyltransferase complex ATPase subunit type 1 TsaE, partial [Gemmataceae bacterium]|nr:tRNA (adenosine(37)-N6)-threonylcarbamoyltransferase complex ATPase subunit type 1 TsaE [Gemmataceae bacterium]